MAKNHEQSVFSRKKAGAPALFFLVRHARRLHRVRCRLLLAKTTDSEHISAEARGIEQRDVIERVVRIEKVVEGIKKAHIRNAKEVAEENVTHPAELVLRLRGTREARGGIPDKRVNGRFLPSALRACLGLPPHIRHETLDLGLHRVDVAQRIAR